MSSHGPPTGAPPPIPHDILVEQKQGQAVLLCAVGAFCIFGWEWLICLPMEYRRIWRKKMTIPSALYLANRYLGLLQFSFVVTLVSNAWGPAACKHMFYWEPVGSLISTLVSQFILGARVYAVYAQNKKVALALCTILIVEVAIGGYTISTTSAPPPFNGPPGTGPPCGAVMGPRGWLISSWSIPIVYDAVVFLLTAWKTYTLWIQEIHTPLINIIWRDGVLYFLAILSMNAANIVIFSTVPEALGAVNLTPTLILQVVLSCRLILNLRGVGSASHTSGSLSGSGSGSGRGPTLVANPRMGGMFHGPQKRHYVEPSYIVNPKGVELELTSSPNGQQFRLEPVRYGTSQAV